MEQFKTDFLSTLRPFIEMLETKRKVMLMEDWVSFVRTVQLRIMTEPEQYLGRELPSQLTVELIINEIFEEFLYEYSSPEVQRKIQVSST